MENLRVSYIKTHAMTTKMAGAIWRKMDIVCLRHACPTFGMADQKVVVGFEGGRSAV